MSNIHSNKISQGIVQYLCDFAKYSHQQISVLSNLPVAVIELIYFHEIPPVSIEAHLKLLKLYAAQLSLKNDFTAFE